MKKLLIFAIPILLSNLLQQLYYAADIVVVGNFARDSKIALAAVGSSGAVSAFLLDILFGLSVGVSVVCANRFGAGNLQSLRRAMETGLLLALAGGILISAVGVVFARPLLALLGSPETVIDEAALYMKIIFLGQPAVMVYNFGAGILRSLGDTRRPMVVLSVTGAVNVVLNLVFVMLFHWDAAGVALATVIANYLSALAVLILFRDLEEDLKPNFRRPRIYREELFAILRVGIPGGINGMMYNFSSVLLSSSVNSLGDVVIAANSAASGIDALIYQFVGAFTYAAISFAGQNYGAGNQKRIDELLLKGLVLVNGILLVVNAVLLPFSDFWLRFFTSDAQVIREGSVRVMVMCGGQLIFSFSEMASACLRGMGKTAAPTLISVFCICILRLLWILFLFPLSPNYWFLMLCYPVSWAFAGVGQIICYLWYRLREKRASLREHERILA